MVRPRQYIGEILCFESREWIRNRLVASTIVQLSEYGKEENRQMSRTIVSALSMRRDTRADGLREKCAGRCIRAFGAPIVRVQVRRVHRCAPMWLCPGAPILERGTGWCAGEISGASTMHREDLTCICVCYITRPQSWQNIGGNLPCLVLYDSGYPCISIICHALTSFLTV